MIYLQTTVTDVGVEVPDLLEGGVLVLYADGAPPALAEVAVQHRSGGVSERIPPIGTPVEFGGVRATVSAVGDTAWAKILDIGHVVFNFNGAAKAERPGEICLTACDAEAIRCALSSGSLITIAD